MGTVNVLSSDDESDEGLALLEERLLLSASAEVRLTPINNPFII